jgi:hypothetical protein
MLTGLCFMLANAPQYGVGGDFGTRFCPPLKMPERGLVAGRGTYHPAAPILLVSPRYSFNFNILIRLSLRLAK